MKKLLFVVLLSAGFVGAASGQDVFDSADKIRPLLPGSQAPAVSLQRQDGSSFELKGRDKPTVLIFYRGGW